MKKTGKGFIAVTLASTVISGLPSCKNDKKTTDENKKPNIILILADDLGYGDLSCFGQKTLKTPNIDSLSTLGLKFYNGYTGAAVCAPSRCSLLTGKHTGHTSVRGNQPDQLLEKGEPTIASLLKTAGYYTGIIGKWGIGHPPPHDDANKFGFDYQYGYINMWHAHNYYPEFLFRNGQKEIIPENKIELVNGKNPYANRPEGTGVSTLRGKYSHDLFESDALNFIDQHKDTTFFLELAFTLPHANNEKEPDGMEVPSWGQFENQSWPGPEKGFASMIQRLDNSVGKIMKKLNDLNLAKNTIVIFTSDNGPHHEGNHTVEFFDSNGKFRGSKRDLFDGGIRTPLIVVWPGKVQPNTSTTQRVAFWDIMPTFCDITGAKAPEKIDGISYLPTLLGKPQEQKQHEYFYWEFYEEGGLQGIVKDNWKMIKIDPRGNKKFKQEVLLYNLKLDTAEKNNVAPANPKIISELDSIMKKAHTEHPKMSLYNMNGDCDTPF